MKTWILRALVAGLLVAPFAAHAEPANQVGQTVGVCDPSHNAGANCLKPNSDGSINIGTGGGSNASVGANGSAHPTSSTVTGYSDGTNTVQDSASTPHPVLDSALNNVIGTQADTANCAVSHSLIACQRQTDADVAAGVGLPGSAVPANTNMVAGQANANAANFPLSAATVGINISTGTTTQIVALSAGKAIYVTSWNLIAGGTGNFTWEYGTGTNCATVVGTLSGAYPLTAQSGLTQGSGNGAVMIVPAGNELCALTSASVQMSGSVSYSQF